MKRYWALLILVTLLGCGSPRYALYEGTKQPDDRVGLVYDNRAYLTILSVDGKPTAYTMGKILEVPSGPHRFVLTWNNSFRPPTVFTASLFRPKEGDPFADISFEVKSGYTYTFSAMQKDKPILDGVPDKVCFYGEPHNAPGSSVNVTGEYRHPSKSVETIACAPIQR
jgi:hypothetical protein